VASSVRRQFRDELLKRARPARSKPQTKPASSLPFIFPKIVTRPELLEDGGDRRFRQFVYDIIVLATALDRARAHLASRVGLTPPQYTMLMLVAQNQNDTPVTVRLIARRLRVSGAFITMEVKKLIQRRLLAKQPNPEDGRSNLLKLTAKAEREIQGLAPEIRMVNDRLFASLNRDNFLAASRLINFMLDDFEATVRYLEAGRQKAAAPKAASGSRQEASIDRRAAGA
jgi:DNA-binding MarR family transcriptional regulator